MIFIFFPIILFLLFWIYILQFNLLISFILAPITYLLCILILFRNKQLMTVHTLLNNLTIIVFIENNINYIVFAGFNLILKVPIINKYYLQCKVKIIMYVINIMIKFIPNKSEPDNKLTQELQNDYLEILNRNKLKLK